MKRILTHDELNDRAYALAQTIKQKHGKPQVRVYPVPRGGIPVAYLLQRYHDGIVIAATPAEADCCVDDLIDSGATRARHSGKPFYTLYDKQKEPGPFLVFPWEGDAVGAIEDNIVRILQYIGEDPQREGLLETPRRVVKSWAELFAGYKMNAEDVFKTFDVKYNELVLMQDIELYSTCVIGSTFVETPRGRVPISKLTEGDWVYSFNEKNLAFELERCSDIRITRKNANIVRVFTDKDTLLCTPDHQILTHERGWVHADQLTNGDRIVALTRGCIEVNGVHRPYLNFFAANGKKQVPEHRFVYESIYGPIGKRDHIHHVDLNPANSEPENLDKLLPEGHIYLHAKQDGRGKRLQEAKQSPLFEAVRKAGVREVHADPIRRAAMIEKRKQSAKMYWDKIKADPQLYKQRTINMNHKVLGVDKCSWKEDVWCMTVPKNHNFIANGMVVHNCEHHMLPFTGRAHVAYIANGKVIGASKLARLVEVFARRLQVQEQIGTQVVDALMEHLKPKGAAVIIEAKHMCMCARGVGKQHSIMKTSAMRGVFLEDSPRGVASRAELLSLLKP